MSSFSVADLVAYLVDAPAASIEGDAERRLSGISTLASARREHVSFLANPQYRPQLASTQAGAVIVNEELAAELHEAPFTRIVTSQPYLYFAKVSQWLESRLHPLPPADVHPSASIDSSARIEDGASVGPRAVIDADVIIAAGARIGAGSYIGPGCRIAAGCVVHANATLVRSVTLGARTIVHSGAVIGADGFGFAPDNGRWEKIAQLGGVRIGADVEIGANTTIDRGALDDTVIEDGAKLDNQIQIGHNVRIGEHTIIAGCAGIAGSTVVGKRCTLGGSAKVVGHITIADDVTVSAATVVMSSITQAGRYTGVYPMDSHRNWEKNAAIVRQLPDVRRRLKKLERP